MAHDPLGRLAGEHDAIGNTETYGYDPVANDGALRGVKQQAFQT